MEPGAGVPLDNLGTAVWLESAFSHYLQYCAVDLRLLSVCLAGKAYLEAAWGVELFILLVHTLQQIYAFLYAGDYLL